MAVVTLELSDEARRKIGRDLELADAFGGVLAETMEHMAGAGGDEVKERFNAGELGLRSLAPGQGGIGGGIHGWMIDRESPLGAIGVSGNYPAAAYAAIHEYGGRITPKAGHPFLAIPLTAEAKFYGTPREMPGLVLIKRKTKSWLLARVFGTRIEPHWVLKESVTIPATHWLSRGVEMALGTMAAVGQADLNAWMEKW